MAYERVNWENLPSKNTPVNADNLNKMDEGIANAVEKSGDTMTGELLFENKNDYAAIRKTRTLNNEDYLLAIGVGANMSARMELIKDPDNVLSSVEVRRDGIYNGVSGRKLVETNDIEKTTLTLGDYFDTIDTNEVTKNGNVVQVVFRGHTKKAIPNNTIFATLPYRTKSSNVVALSTMGEYSLGNFIFSYTGSSDKSWRCGGISTDKWVQANFVYITSD